MWRKQARALSLYMTDPTAMIADIHRAVVPSMSDPVSASMIGRWQLPLTVSNLYFPFKFPSGATILLMMSVYEVSHSMWKVGK